MPVTGSLVKLQERGFTLIELLIGIAIAAILLVLAMPTYVRWIADSAVGNAASSVADGVRLAQAEAIKRNANVEFTLTSSSGWSVQLPSGTAFKEGAVADGAKGPAFTPSPSTSTTITFNSVGQVESANVAAPTTPFTSIDVDSAAGSRLLRVIVGNGVAGTGIRICDRNTALPTYDPQRCP